MNGHSLSAREGAPHRTIPEAHPPDLGVMRPTSAVELVRERPRASGANSEQRAASPRTRA